LRDILVELQAPAAQFERLGLTLATVDA